MKLKINEIFYTIQGESLDAGLACVMVRLSGCNLRCTYCDTTYAYEEGQDMPLDAVMETVAGFGCNRVEITGGEPLLQAGTPFLIDWLADRGCHVLLETNGTFDIGGINPACVIIMDIKCPSSAESDKTEWRNLNHLKPQDQVKFVIADPEDYRFARATTRDIKKLPAENILFSPAAGRLSPAQ